MGKRRNAREIVLQALYELELSGKSPEDVIAAQLERRTPLEETADHSRELFLRTANNIPELDKIIVAALENWDIERIAIVDKNVLRFALAEVLYFAEVPSKVIINEAIEVARRYGSDESGKFINGLLDRFIREYRKGFE